MPKNQSFYFDEMHFIIFKGLWFFILSKKVLPNPGLQDFVCVALKYFIIFCFTIGLLY